MTLRMAAGQQKKRLLSSTLCEQYRGKKKKRADSSDYVLNLNSHTVLEWDNRQKRAVAKREQIAIRWKDVAPFLNPVPHNRTSLAGVLCVPHEIFGLENLTEVLSYEVWATCLSEGERKLLSQFLPSGISAEQVVQSLLTGENHHFGNPLINWSVKLCSGNFHPDEALHTQKQLKANKKAYYKELEKYHTNMLDVLKNWKEIWVTCQDPEKLRQAFTMNKGWLPVSTEKNKTLSVSKKDLPQKLCVRYGDAAKYMSYIKISKKQLDLIKGMKQSGDGIHSKTVNHVLGDIKSFHVEPYEEFEAEEKKRLHVHWLQVAKSNVPVAYEGWRSRKMQKQQWSKSLEQELPEKITLIHAKTVETRTVEGPSNDESSSHHSVRVPDPEEEDDSNADSAGDSSTHSHLEMASRASDQEADCYSSEKTVLERVPSQNTHLEMDPSISSVQKATTMYSSEKMVLERIPSLNSHMEIDERVSDQEATPSEKTDVGCIPSSTSTPEIAYRVSDQEADHYSSEKTDTGHVTSMNDHLEMASRVSDQEADQRASGKPDLECTPSLNNASQFSLRKTDNIFERRDSDEDYHDMGAMGAEDTQKPIDDSLGKTNSSQDDSNQEVAGHHILQPRNDIYESGSPQIDVMGLQSMSSGKEMWQQTVSAHDPYFGSSPRIHAYAGDLPLRKAEDQRAPIIDLERDILEQPHNISSSMPPHNGAPIFSSYANHNHNDMLHTFSKGPELLPSFSLAHLNGLKESGMQFLMADGSLSGSGHFSNQFQERQGFQEQRQLRQKDMYMNPSVDNNSINSGSFQSVERQNMAAVESSLHAVISPNNSNNWFSGDYGARNSWLQQQITTNNGGQQGLGDVGGSDGSLLSVLSSCKMAPPHSSPFNATRSDQFVMPRNRVSGDHRMTNENIYSFIPDRLIGASSYEAATMQPPSMKVNNHLSWLNNLQHQSGDMHDLAGSQFPRPWEQ